MSPGRERLRIALTLIPMLASLVLGIGLLHRRAVRLDLTPEQRYTLSQHARGVLATLPHATRITAFLRGQDPRNTVLRDLLRQVAAAAPGVQTRIVDVNRTPALARAYGVRGVAFVVESGDRRRVVSNPREETLVAGMLEVMRRDRTRIGWVLGHGEGDPESSERRTGFGAARRALELEHREIERVTLATGGLAEDLEALVVAGPTADYLPEELQVLDRWMRGSGRLLVMLEPGRTPRLVAWLEQWGTAIGADLVIDPNARLYGGEGSTIRLTLDQRAHPIVRPLAAPPLFARARSVGPQARRQGTTVRTILETGHGSFAAPMAVADLEGALAFDPRRDRRGPIPVGVAVTAAAAGGASEARLVVYGSAEFANNFFLDFLGNKDLFLNSVAWLTVDETVIAHRPPRQRPGVHQFFVSEEQGRQVFRIAVGLQPGLLAGIGAALVLWRRRR